MGNGQSRVPNCIVELVRMEMRRPSTPASDDATSTTSGSLANAHVFIRLTVPDDTSSTTNGSSARPANGDFSISTTAPDDTTRSHRIMACIPIPFDLGTCEPISTFASLLRNAFQPPNNNQGLDGGLQGDDGNKKILALWRMALLTPSLVIATALYKPASGVVFSRNKAAYYITLGAIFVAGIVELFTAIFLSRSRNAAEKFGTIALCLSILPLVAIIGIGGFAFIQG